MGIAIIALIGAALAADCDIEQTLAKGEEHLLYLDFDAAKASLEQVEKDFDCRLVTRQEQAKFWLLTGALAAFTDKPDDAAVALRTAREVDPGYWLDALGVDLQQQWSDSEPPTGRGTLEVVPVPKRFVVYVDGREQTDSPIELDEGFHVVQVLSEDAEGTGLGRIIEIDNGSGVVLRTDMKRNEPVTQADNAGWNLVVGLGGGLLGQVSDSQETTRPVGGAEVGLHFQTARWWVRPSISASAGGFSYVQGDQIASLPVSPTLGLAGGVQVQQVRFGAQTGIQLPGRVPLLGIVGAQLSRRWSIEARAGVNALALASTSGPSVRRWEPAAGLHVLFHL